MKWSSSGSENPVFEKAFRECCEKVERELHRPPDLAFLFVSPHHRMQYKQIPSQILKILKAKTFIGCSAGGVIGGGKEIEQKNALSLTAALLPDVEIFPFQVSNDTLPDLDARPKAWHDLLRISPEKEPHFILLLDPFTSDGDKFAMGMDYAFPKSVKVGGLASGAQRKGENMLFLNQQCYEDGLVGVGLAGNLMIDTVVAQGCRPIGEPLVITACHHNILLELNSTTPMKVLEGLFESLQPRDQHLFRTSLFLGVVMNSHQTSFSFGDFLIRNIIGVDTEKGILSVGAELREGQTVQFHLRDAQTSADDLDHMLSRYSTENQNVKARGALLFSCLGRGVYLYGTPDHDSRLFQKKIGTVPLGGFFCNGEVGPVNKTTYIHGYTSCFGLFREKKNAN